MMVDGVDYDVVWTGSDWRDGPQPVVAMATPGAVSSVTRVPGERVDAFVLRVLRSGPLTIMEMAARGSWGITSLREGLARVVRAGHVVACGRESRKNGAMKYAIARKAR